MKVKNFFDCPSRVSFFSPVFAIMYLPFESLSLKLKSSSGFPLSLLVFSITKFPVTFMFFSIGVLYCPVVTPMLSDTVFMLIMSDETAKYP